MTVAFYTNFVSPHQLPLAREFVRQIGVENYRYIYTEPFDAEHTTMEWGVKYDPVLLFEPEQLEESYRWLRDVDVLISSLRDLKLFNERCARGKTTFYFSERWFKPIPLRFCGFYLPGWLRLFSPSYFKMVYQFVRWMHQDEKALVLATGMWARRDFCRMGIPRGKIIDWGYFVQPSKLEKSVHMHRQPKEGVLRVLWVGRMLTLKRVDTLINAVGACLEKFPIELTIVGDGPERKRLSRLAEKVFMNHPSFICFQHKVLISEVRNLMQKHDVYVFTSNGEEGWGAVVSEALEEGMDVLGTFECGACPTLLSKDRLFHSGDVKTLARLLEKEWKGELSPCSSEGWTAKDGANRFLEICANLQDRRDDEDIDA